MKICMLVLALFLFQEGRPPRQEPAGNAGESYYLTVVASVS